MYKKIILMAIVIVQWSMANSQTISRKVLPGAGGTLSGTSNQLTYSIGEPVTATLNSGSNILTQGFQQPGEELKLINLPSSLCAGRTVSLSYDAIDIGGGNTFKIELSNATGSFTIPKIIGTRTGNTSGNISVTVPASTTAGQPSLTTHTVGESYGGGTVFYVYDNGQHGLIAATNDVNGGLNIRWYAGTNTNTMAFGDGIGAGASNTTIIVANQGNGDGAPYAARLCQAYSVTVSGVTYGDWYLPSKSELDLLLHQQGIVGNIQSYGYWSSTEGSTTGAWRQDRNNYIQYQTNKTGPTDGSSVRARPIRRF